MRTRVIAAMALSSVVAAPSRADPKLADAIRERATPLRAVGAGHGFDDMEPIAGIVGNARVVALGESSHGSREIFQLKHRMVEFLASRMGFSIFAIEASMPDAALLNDYVQHGRGDPAALIEKMGFWTWSTEEVLDFVRWMRDFNRSGRRIEFAGFDMQMPETSIHIVREYLRKHDAGYLATIAPVFEEVRKVERNEVARTGGQNQRSGLSAGTVDPAAGRLVRQCEGVLRGLKKRVLPTPEGAWVVQNGRLILQFARRQAHQQQRDELMAENVRWLAEQHPRAKLILWAHNDHLSHRSNYEMGGHLRDLFQDAFVNFGIVFNHGSFRAVGLDGRLQEFVVDEMPYASVEGTLAAVGLPVIALDLRDLRDGRFSEWVESLQTMRDIGAVFDASSMRDVCLAESFDALLYVETSHASKALRRSGDGLH